MKKISLVTLVFLVAVPLMAAEPDAAALFKAKCAMCHGADGSGNTPVGKTMKVRDLRSADVQKEKEADLVNIITNGKNKMPAFKGKLTAADIDALADYILKFTKK